MVFDESPDNEYAILVSHLSSHPPLISTSQTLDPSSAESEQVYPLPPLDLNTFLPPRKISSPFKGPFLPPCSRKLSPRNPIISLLSNRGWTLQVSYPFILSLLDLPKLFPTNHLPRLDSLPLPSPKGEWLEKLACRNERKTWNEERD